MKIVLAMITINRMEFDLTDEKRSGKNYINQTMQSLDRSGLWGSSTPYELHVYDGGSKDLSFIEPQWRNRMQLHTIDKKILPRENCGRAIIDATNYGGDWIMFLEDDIAVCKDFLDAAASWIERNVNEQHRVLTFYTPYREVQEAVLRGVELWHYPVLAFYGTQAIAIRTSDAQSCGDHIHDDVEYSPQSYDLSLKRWHMNNYPDHGHFLATAPCFVQHTGEDSALNPGRFHACQSFIGEDWRPNG